MRSRAIACISGMIPDPHVTLRLAFTNVKTSYRAQYILDSLSRRVAARIGQNERRAYAAPAWPSCLVKHVKSRSDICAVERTTAACARALCRIAYPRTQRLATLASATRAAVCRTLIHGSHLAFICCARAPRVFTAALESISAIRATRHRRRLCLSRLLHS